MKKFFFALFFLNCSFLFCHVFSFSLAPFFSYNNNTLTYSIYDGTKLNSQLDWKSPYMLSTGLQTNFQYNNLILNISNAAAIPMKSGNMFDSDWYTPGIKTNLSKSDLYTDFCYDLKIELKYRFEIPKDFSILPTFSFSYSYSSLNAKNTIGWCGDTGHTNLNQDYPWDSEYAVTVKKEGIDLINNIYQFYCGIQIEKDLNNFQLAFATSISPYIYISSIDHHLNNLGGRYYLLLQEAFFPSFYFDLFCNYKLNSKNSIFLKPSFCFCPEIKGTFYFGKTKSEEALVDQPCTFNFSKFSITLGWSFSF